VLTYRVVDIKRVDAKRRASGGAEQVVADVSRAYYLSSTVYYLNLKSRDPSLRDLLDTRAPPSAPTMPETAATPAATITESAPESAPELAPELASEPVKPAPKQAANTAHKRQISEAIPRNERADAGKAHLEEEDHTYTGGGAGSGGAGTECRRSGECASPNSAVKR
jgi:hypothetical protein